MPIIKSAIKKLKQAKARAERNKGQKQAVKNLLDVFRKKPGKEAFAKLSSALDKLAKKNIIHRNKAARLKSRLSKLIAKPAKTPVTEAPKRSKKTAKSKAVKN